MRRLSGLPVGMVGASFYRRRSRQFLGRLVRVGPHVSARTLVVLGNSRPLPCTRANRIVGLACRECQQRLSIVGLEFH